MFLRKNGIFFCMKNDFFQKSLFDEFDEIPKNEKIAPIFDDKTISKFKSYNLQNYVSDIENRGIKYTWTHICEYVLTFGENEDFLNIKNFGEMYEIALAIQDKIQKKKNGQYYTPEDVALLMSEWFDSLDGENICDVACGTGKLILTFLDFAGKDKAKNILENGQLYLYDIDEIALNICKTSILLKYGKNFSEKIHCFAFDFLSSKIKLPQNCKVISNPPYTTIQQAGKDWKETEVLADSRELYSCFMEKIIQNSISSVIITPYSFISGAKFYSLRKILNQKTGEIYSFDNVPGNIFCGRKHGIFNTNTSNSVRATISVIRSDSSDGFKLTPLIRFKSVERKELLQCKVLESFLPSTMQKISKNAPAFYKCFKELQPLYDVLIQKSNNHTLGELVSNTGAYTLSTANTCRYFTSAFCGLMNRNGLTVLHFDDEKKFNYAYCLINSSFAYWHWRLFDGGITYPVGLLLKTPIIFDLLTEDDHDFLKKTKSNSSRRVALSQISFRCFLLKITFVGFIE